MSKCQWCGKEYTKTWNSQKYCCETCRKYAYQEKTALRVRKYRKRFGSTTNSVHDLGSGSLHSHMRPDFNTELSMIRNELRRLKIKI